MSTLFFSFHSLCNLNDLHSKSQDINSIFELKNKFNGHYTYILFYDIYNLDT